MKKTLTTLCLLPVAAMLSQGADLLAEWNGFGDDSTVQNGYHFYLHEEGSDSSYTDNGTLLVKPAGHTAYQPHVNLASAGLTLKGGLTFSLLLKDYSGGVIAGVGNEGISRLFAFGSGTDATTLQFDASASNANNAATGAVAESAGSYTLYTVTSAYNEETSRTEFALYENGVHVNSGWTEDDELASEQITSLALGGWLGMGALTTGSSYELSRLAVYDGALTASEVKSHASAWGIPEPTTATLSLLALAGLAVRRRRK